jgi:hypothetical protein
MSNDSAVTVEHDALVLGTVRVTFQRTLRIPECGLHDLPPGLGAFPIRRVEDYPDTVPAEWRERGGVMIPIYQREAMWMSFDSDEPAALQVGIGKVCAISSWRPARLLRQGQATSGPSRARQRRAGCDPGQITTNHDVGVRDQSVPKTGRSPTALLSYRNARTGLRGRPGADGALRRRSNNVRPTVTMTLA